MIIAIAEAQADAERIMGRLMTDDEAERFRASIRQAYRERGLL